MLAPGTIVGGYRIELLLGRGAMGEVYRAVQLALDRPVAVKRIAAHLLDQPGAVARFEREARCLARVHCEQVVAIHDFGRFADQQGGEHWLIVMELVEGMSLGKVLATRGRLPWPEAAVLARHIAEGLAAVAELGVVHRDLKPDNILISRRGMAKITDFGLARASDSSTMTAEGAMLGTPLYMPPEACRGEMADARGDLYSLGCTWFHALVGQPPYRASSSIALLRLHVEQPIPDVLASVPDMPADLARLLTSLMAKQPQDRPANATAVVEAISACSAVSQLPRMLDVTALPLAEQPTLIPGTPTPATRPPAAARPAELAFAQGSAAVRATAATQVATAAITALPSDAALAASATTLPARRLGSLSLVLMAAGIALFGLGGGWLLSRSTADRDVSSALAAGDTSLALQRAGAALADRPGDAAATALVRRAISAEVERLCAETRHDDALARLLEHRQRWNWLDTGTWEKQIAMDRGHTLVRQGRIQGAFDAFIALRERNTDDVEVARAILAAFPTHDQDGLVLVSAALLVQRSEKGQAKDPVVDGAIDLLAGSLEWDGAFGSRAERTRTILIQKHPDPAGLGRKLLENEAHEARENGFLLLTTLGALTDSQTLRYHWRTVSELSTTYSVTAASLEYLTTTVAAANWVERKDLAKLPPPPESMPGLTAWNDHASGLISLLAQGFAAESLHPALRWSQAEDQQLRWNAWRLLERLQASDRIDAEQFHLRTLTTFNPLYASPDFLAALAWCRSTNQTIHARSARRALNAAEAHVTAQYKRYRKVDDGRSADDCKQRLQAIEETLDQVEEP